MHLEPLTETDLELIIPWRNAPAAAGTLFQDDTGSAQGVGCWSPLTWQILDGQPRIPPSSTGGGGVIL